ncbi:MAG: alcohol dehydrogenase catalytic domain-containing protein [Thermoplasmatales archaeon]|jgi:D-arabinose 1-dehydrogenase-like Zn-dependent alcohol dehydrogenase|nr:alcohol dehydrogenase catalytic domain-containing protein [Thermoplasmatales archaeon]
MKAAVLYGKEKLNIVSDFDDPVVKDSDVLINSKNVGLCSTDRTLYRGFVPFKPPLIIGHEIAGIVEDLGKLAKGFDVGDHVIIPPVYPGCEDENCPACREGLTNRCKNSVFIGHGVHGGDAELIAVPSRYTFKIKESVPLNEACIIPDAVSTPFHALKSRSIPPHIVQNTSNPGKLFDKKTHWLKGKNVVVFGVGGVGGPTVNLAAKYFQAKNVLAVDIFDNKLEFAKKLGATHTVNSKTYFEENNIQIKELAGRDKAKAISGLARGISSNFAEDKFQVDCVLDCSGVSDTFPVAVETASKNRVIIQVGWPPKPVSEFLNQKIMDKYLTINGTWACPMNELEENVKAVEAGIVDLDLLVTNKDYTLDGLENAIHDLEAGKILGRATISIV